MLPGEKRRKSMITSIIYTIKREFKAQSRSLTHDKPDRFCKSQWHVSGSKGCVSAYLLYKWLIAAYLLVGLVISLVDLRTLGMFPWPENAIFRLKWAIYLTNWTAVILFLQAVMAAVLATKHHLTPAGQSEQQMTKLHKSYWLLNNLGNVLSPAVTLLYWTTVYNPKIFSLDFVNVHNHIVNSVLVVIELAVASHPVRLLHLYQPMVFAFVYAGFTAVYSLCGGTNRQGDSKIYPLLNWQRPGRALLAVCAASLLLVVLHVLVWLFYLLRRKIAIALVPSNATGRYVVDANAPVTELEHMMQIC